MPCGCKHCRPQILWQLALKKPLTLLVQLLGHLLSTLSLLSHASKDNTITGANTRKLEPCMCCTCSDIFLIIRHMHYAKPQVTPQSYSRCPPRLGVGKGTRAYLRGDACPQANAIQEGQVGAMGVGGQRPNAGRCAVDEACPGQQVADGQRRASQWARPCAEELPELEQALGHLGPQVVICERTESA